MPGRLGRRRWWTLVTGNGLDMTNLDVNPSPPSLRVNRHLATAAAYSWRLLAVGLSVAAALWLTGQLLVVVIPLAVAALLTRALSPVSSTAAPEGRQAGDRRPW